MYINDAAGGQGVYQEVDDLCDSDSSSYTIISKTRRANNALFEMELMILMADGTWQFDDANYANQPSGVQSAVDGQQEYTYDATLLFIERVEILMLDGKTWQRLDPMNEITTPMTQTDFAIAATPSAYYKRGNKFGFNSLPKATNMTLASGIKVFFKRLGAAILTTDTTLVPGIPVVFHPSLARRIALPYCQTYKKDRVAQLQQTITADNAFIKQYYANRTKDEKTTLGMRRINPR